MNGHLTSQLLQTLKQVGLHTLFVDSSEGLHSPLLIDIAGFGVPTFFFQNPR